MDSRREKYLDNIVEHLVNGTKYDTDHLNVYIIKFPFSDGWEVFGSHREMSDIYDISPERFGVHRWNFDQEMIEVFDLIEDEADYVWENYFEGARFFGNEYAKSDGLINEGVNKQKEYLEYVYNDLVNNTKFRDASYRDIDIYDGKCKSLQIGIRWGSEAPYFNYVPDCLENYLKDYWGLTYNEIQELFWDKYDEHIINMVLSKKENVSPHVRVHVDYLRESKYLDKQTEFLQKIVDIMIEETVPYNLSKGSVITPFVADKNSNGKYILSANHCKNMVDYFEDEFTLGNIFINYLEMFGLSYEEMEEVMYSYFNVLFEKFFKRFFDLSYKTRPRLDESVDLGFVDKVTDIVLKEIVWDFDKGHVYFPMIDYTSHIRDDGFLAAVYSDDAFSLDFSEPNTNWHVDLMNHIEDNYAITGNEFNRVWGSLQGEIWEKTEEYWNSFTRGY